MLDAWYATQHSDEPNDELIDATAKTVVERQRTAHDDTATVHVILRRMVLRLPPDHPVPSAYAGLRDALEERLTSLDDTAVRRDAIDQTVDKPLRQAAMDKWDDFVHAAREELETRGAVARSA